MARMCDWTEKYPLQDSRHVVKLATVCLYSSLSMHKHMHMHIYTIHTDAHKHNKLNTALVSIYIPLPIVKQVGSLLTWSPSNPKYFDSCSYS